MNSQEHEDVRTRMPEAALLPPSHPLRQAIVEHIAATDGPLEREWLDLVQEDERLRVELARMKPPSPDLHRRLMEIPVQSQPDSLITRSRWWIIAAVILIVVLIVLLAVR
ncbi:MAG TPA: hypothetical protein VGR35_13450 [Tepidisphaeraceae bacterium]|nr:hypothetical protein [Tepidisphaeraceae bacterium]